ncbi:hypothetical protein Hanom_Chr08g00709171 [Helianthus anomalus]
MEDTAGVRVPNPSFPSQFIIFGVVDEWRMVRGLVVVKGKGVGLGWWWRREETVRRGRETAERVVAVVVVVLRRSILKKGV